MARTRLFLHTTIVASAIVSASLSASAFADDSTATSSQEETTSDAWTSEGDSGWTETESDWTETDWTTGEGDYLWAECGNENGSCYGSGSVSGDYYLECGCGNGAYISTSGNSQEAGIVDWSSFQQLCNTTVSTSCQPYYHVNSNCSDDWGNCSVSASEYIYSPTNYNRSVSCSCRDGDNFSYSDNPTSEISSSALRGECRTELAACRNSDAQGAGDSGYPAVEGQYASASCASLWGQCYVWTSSGGSDSLECYCFDGSSLYENGDLGLSGLSPGELTGVCNAEVLACDGRVGDDDDDTTTSDDTSSTDTTSGTATSTWDDEEEDDDNDDTSVEELLEAFGCTVAPNSNGGFFGSIASLGLLALMRRRRQR